jgi:hypothetical protein
MGALTAGKSPCDGVEEWGGGLAVVHAELHLDHYTVGAHLQTTRERGCSVACMRHGELCCGSGGTRIVRVVNCGYNNVVFKANEYLFEKILETLIAIARSLLLGVGNECLHLFVVRSCWVDDSVSYLSTSPRWCHPGLLQQMEQAHRNRSGASVPR